MIPQILMIEFPPDQQGLIRIVFALEENGMCIGAVYGGQATFGEEEPAMTRNFVDQEHAILWVKQKCRERIGREDVDFIVQKPSEKHIVVPRPHITMPKGRM